MGITVLLSKRTERLRNVGKLDRNGISRGWWVGWGQEEQKRKFLKATGDSKVGAHEGYKLFLKMQKGVLE